MIHFDLCIGSPPAPEEGVAYELVMSHGYLYLNNYTVYVRNCYAAA